MICPQCRATVPDESAFCLRCGARLRSPERPARTNGGGSALTTAPRETPPASATTRGPTAAPGGKHPYALSFKPLADERLRYRVARWVCEQAPAHGLPDVQAALTRGEFATFLALTHDEAGRARASIEALGAHPALWQLAPATAAELLLPRTSPPATAGWSLQKKLVVAVLTVAALAGLGTAAMYLHHPGAPVSPGAPSIGGQP